MRFERGKVSRRESRVPTAQATLRGRLFLFLPYQQEAAARRRNRGAACYNRPMATRRPRGFTLLELIVVIAIIALAFGILFAVFDGILERGRDGRRLSDMSELRKALSLYTINRGRFPVSVNPVTITGSDEFSNLLLSEGVIQAVPADPLHPDFTYTYQSNSLGTSYTISFCLETDSVKGFTKGCGNTVSP